MSRPNEELQKEIEELLKLGQEGTLDFTTCTEKIARKVLEQSGCDELLHVIIAALLSTEALTPVGVVVHLLVLRILRLESDVRQLRSELVKDRMEDVQEHVENITYRGEGETG